MTERLFSKILVPVDFSSRSEEAYLVALSLARLYQAEILLLHVVDTTALQALNARGLACPSEEAGQRKRLSHQARLSVRRLEQLDEAKGVPIRRVVAEGSPFVEIVRVTRSERVSLVVMGSYGGLAASVDKMFFGSTAEKVVRTAGCPVLTVPVPGPLPSQQASKHPA